MRLLLILAGSIFLPFLAFSQTTWYVPDDFPAIQDAIDNSSPGDTVVVRPGTYLEHINFLGKTIIVGSELGPDVTTIDATGLGASVVDFGREPEEGTLLEGFTITGGTGTWCSYEYRGGGIYCDTGNAAVIDCRVVGNSAGRGGGMHCSGGDMKVINCHFADNAADSDGGGIDYSLGNPILTGCTFFSNRAGQGGGMAILDSYEPGMTLTGCLFLGNYAESDGGGMAAMDSSPTLIDCLFSNNHAGGFGGGMDSWYCFPSKLTNCTFARNHADGSGGGIRVLSDRVKICNGIFLGNEDSGGMDESAQIHRQQATIHIDYTCVQGWTGGFGGTGNMGEDPLFVAPEYGDYRLLWSSPCIDSGDPGSLDPDGTRSDMGAHSFDQSKELIVYLSPETRCIEPGATGRVKYTVCNSKPQEKNFGAAAGVRLPDGAPWPGNPLEDPVYTLIAPSSNLTREFEYRVPPGWLPGTYTLAVGIGYQGCIYDLDHFEFFVEE